MSFCFFSCELRLRSNLTSKLTRQGRNSSDTNRKAFRVNVCKAASRESDRTLRIIIMWAASEGDKIGICYVHIANAGLLSECSGEAEGCTSGEKYSTGGREAA